MLLHWGKCHLPAIEPLALMAGPFKESGSFQISMTVAQYSVYFPSKYFFHSVGPNVVAYISMCITWT